MAAVVVHVCRSLAVSERQLFQINLSFIGNGRLALDGRLLMFISLKIHLSGPDIQSFKSGTRAASTLDPLLQLGEDFNAREAGQS